VTLKLAVSRSRPPVPYGANLLYFLLRRGSTQTHVKHMQNKLAPCGTDGRLFVTDVSASFKVP